MAHNQYCEFNSLCSDTCYTLYTHIHIYTQTKNIRRSNKKVTNLTNHKIKQRITMYLLEINLHFISFNLYNRKQYNFLFK